MLFNFTDIFRVNSWLSFIFGLRSMEAYCKSLPLSDGLAACVDHVIKDRQLNIDSLKKSAIFVPQTGPLLITSNHPTGILDGAVLLCALLSRRSDIFIVGNDLLTKIPLLSDIIIPIKKTQFGDQNGIGSLIRVKRVWKQNACVVVFPAGTVEHWQWNKFKVCDAPWTEAFQNLAEISKVPQICVHLPFKNPVWFHIFSAFFKKARYALLIHAFFSTKNKNKFLPVIFKI